MEKIGVEAVVAGLSSFLGDMKKIDSSISGLVPGTKLLENAFGFLGNTIDGFINFTLNALAHALGELIADAIEFVIQKIGELVQATIEAGAEFQTLELRLQTLNFNTLTESGVEYNEATAESIRLTKEQLEWLQKLAVTTPYDAADIANVFTLARSYGFVDDEARTLTETISNFAAGMGLGNVEIERIIVNFGQMVQQGKVTQREMNDLARGSFVPVNDILKLMQENLGMSTAELEDFRQTGEGVDEFMKAFIQLVEQRFTGSAEKMARTFQGATANMQDLIKSIGGLNIVKPILDAIGGRIADFITELTAEDNWDDLVEAANNVANAILPILDTLLDLFVPSADSAAEGVINALNGIADWLNEHRGDITAWIIEASRWINNVLIPDIKRVLKWLFGSDDETGAIERFGEWLGEVFVPAIKEAAKWGEEVLIPFLRDDLYPIFLALVPLAAAVGDVLITAFGGEPDQEFTDWIHDRLIPGIQNFTDWLITNKDEIALWVNRLLVATIQIALFIAVITLVVSVITNIVAAFADWLVVSGHWLKIAIAIVIVMTLMNITGLGLIATIAIIVGVLLLLFASLKLVEIAIRANIGSIEIFLEATKRAWEEWKENIVQTFNEVIAALKEGDWEGAGRALIDGIIRGIELEWDRLLDVARALAQNAVEAFKESFTIGFDFSNLGFSGIEGMNSPTGSSTAQGSQSIRNTNTSNSYNLTINSSAQTENVVQDFRVLQSLGGR